jgi:uncharacterized protein YdiU (UPF0061 family)
MDGYDSLATFSSIDVDGRYAYGRQPAVATWNLARLAEALAPLLADRPDRALALAQQAVAGFDAHYGEAILAGFRRKLGLRVPEAGDAALIDGLLRIMSDNAADFTLTFRHLGDAAAGDGAALRELFIDTAALDVWLAAWRARLGREGGDAFERQAAMHAANPLFIPRNHRIDAVIGAATAGDLAPFSELVRVLADPCREQPGYERYAEPPTESERVRTTFCGT